MSILEDHNKIKDIASEIRVAPPAQAWDKINDKLDKSAKFSKRKKSNLIKFWFAVAACLMVILTCFTVIFYESHQPCMYDKGKVASWEELAVDQTVIYSIEQARDLNRHYNP